MADIYYVGEHGRTIEVETGQDLSGYALGDLSLQVKKPDGTQVTWAAASRKDGEKSSSIIVYNLQDGDLNMRGNFIVQSQVDSASPNVLELGDPVTMKVLNKGETTR